MISIGLRDGVYVLAQMVREPYLVFFNCFNLDKDWPGLDLNQEQILFCHAVTRQFLRFSSVTVQKNILPLEDYRLPGEWIYSHLGGSPVSLSLNGKTWDLKGFGGQYSLVQADKSSGLPQDNPIMGLFQSYIIADIQKEDWARVKDAETMSIEIFPQLNERLYLCYLAGKNVNPELDLCLGRPLPSSYQVYLELNTGQGTAHQLYLEEENLTRK